MCELASSDQSNLKSLRILYEGPEKRRFIFIDFYILRTLAGARVARSGCAPQGATQRGTGPKTPLPTARRRRSLVTVDRRAVGGKVLARDGARVSTLTHLPCNRSAALAPRPKRAPVSLQRWHWRGLRVFGRFRCARRWPRCRFSRAATGVWPSPSIAASPTMRGGASGASGAGSRAAARSRGARTDG